MKIQSLNQRIKLKIKMKIYYYVQKLKNLKSEKMILNNDILELKSEIKGKNQKKNFLKISQMN